MASSVAFWAAWQGMFICAGCRKSLPKARALKPEQSSPNRPTFIVTAVSYSSTVSQRSTFQKDESPKEAKSELKESENQQYEGLASSKGDIISSGTENASQLLDFAASMEQGAAMNESLAGESGSALWHENGAKSKKGPLLNSRSLRVAMFLRDKGLVLNKTIDRAVGEQSIEEVQAVFKALKKLGCKKAQAVGMVQRYPILLAQSPTDIQSAAEYFQGLGVVDIVKLATRSPSILGPNVEQYPAVVDCLKGWSFKAADIVQVIESDPRVLRMPVPSLLDRLLFLVGQVGLDESALARAVTAFPGLLCYSVDKHLQPRLEFLQAIGFSPSQISELVVRYPRFFSFSMQNKVAPTLQFLLELGLSEPEVVDLVVRKPAIFDWRGNIESTLRPSAAFLEETLGSRAAVCRLVFSEPRLLLASAEEQRAICERWKGLGFSEHQVRNAITRRPALLVKGSDWDAEPKIEFLRDFGLSDFNIARVLVTCGALALPRMEEKVSTLQSVGLTQEQIVLMLGRFPGILQSSSASLEAKIRFLTEDMGRSLEELVSYPAFTSLSLEQRILPRFRILQELGLPRWSLTRAFARPNDAFQTDVRKWVAAGRPKGARQRKGRDPQEPLDQKIEWLVQLGMGEEQAVHVLTIAKGLTLPKMQNKVSMLLDLGLSKQQLVEMLVKYPKTLYASQEGLESKVRFLEDEMGRSLDDLVIYPAFISMSLEKRLRPRHVRLQELGIKALSLSYIYAKTDADFEAKVQGWLVAKSADKDKL